MEIITLEEVNATYGSSPMPPNTPKYPPIIHKYSIWDAKEGRRVEKTIVQQPRDRELMYIRFYYLKHIRGKPLWQWLRESPGMLSTPLLNKIMQMHNIVESGRETRITRDIKSELARRTKGKAVEIVAKPHAIIVSELTQKRDTLTKRVSELKNLIAILEKTIKELREMLAIKGV